MRTNWGKLFIGYSVAAVALLLSSCSTVNTVYDPHFTEDGYCLDSLKENFVAEAPKSLSFYVEVSGSMNGFFRSNRATRFKKDVWSIVSNFGGNDVCVLSNAGTVAGIYSVNDFRSRMNSGGFVSNQETLVPTMLKSILSNLNYNDGQCAVLISDMKYSPEKQKDVKVLLTQYQTDIRNAIGQHPGLAVSLIMAKSDFLAANGVAIEENSKANEEILMEMYEEYQSKGKQYQQNADKWSPAILESKQKELVDLETRLQQTQQSLQSELQQVQARLQAPIVEKAQKIVNELAAAKGVVAVFDKTQLLYVDPLKMVNLTPEARTALKIPEGRTLEQLQQELQAKAQAQAAAQQGR